MKSIICRFFTIISSLICGSGLFAQAAVTYDFSGGRFGDNLLAYLHAKWLSYEYQIPLLHKPFKYSSELVLSDKEVPYESLERFARIIRLDRSNPKPSPHTSNLFVCPYFTESMQEIIRYGGADYLFSADWKNKEFRKIAREMISPKRALQIVHPPKDTLNVAIHLRDGIDFDGEEHKFFRPLKTPPLTFYANSLLKVLELFPAIKIYCHIFTDTPHPQELCDKIIALVPANAPVVYNFRTVNNKHDANVLEDFFSLFNFDVLIRPESTYSIVPSLLNDYIAVYSPNSFTIRGREVTIDEIKVEINEDLYRQFYAKFPLLQ